MHDFLLGKIAQSTNTTKASNYNVLEPLVGDFNLSDRLGVLDGADNFIQSSASQFTGMIADGSTKVDGVVNVAKGNFAETAEAVANAGEGKKNKAEVNIEKNFNPLIEKIKSNPYGKEILEKILNHPRLASLEISEPSGVQASVEKSLGLRDPFVRTYHLKDTDEGLKRAHIIMDASFTSANISLYNGSTLDVGPDAVLFHELSHVFLDLEGKSNTEFEASLHEGLYGNYNRKYEGGATLKW